jgi:hypothetical protein
MEKLDLRIMGEAGAVGPQGILGTNSANGELRA